MVGALIPDGRSPRLPRTAGRVRGSSHTSTYAWALTVALWVLPGLACNRQLSFRDPRDAGNGNQNPMNGDAGAEMAAPTDGNDKGDVLIVPDVRAEPDAPVDMAVDVAPDVAPDRPVDVPTDLPRDLPIDLPRDLPVDVPTDLPRDLPVDAGGPIVCNVEADCRLGLHCLTTIHACVECVIDGQCPKRCNTVLHRCVECNVATFATDCPTTNAEHSSSCQAMTFRCYAGCDDSSDACVAPLFCSSTASQCIECETAANCVGSPRGPICFNNICTQCAVRADCTNAAAPLCDTFTGRCVQCQTSADCPRTAPNCAAGTFTCAP